jgi:ankyrin repeat domain-containing protein 50
MSTHCECLFYFCDNRKRLEESASTILQGLIHQFLSKRPYLFDSLVERSDIMDSYPFSTTSLSWLLALLWKIFTIIMSNSQLQEVYCIIDALDECDYALIEDLLEFLLELTNAPTIGNTKIKVFFTSRPCEHIIEGLSYSLCIRIDLEIVKPDIDKIVSDRLGKLQKRLCISKQRQQEF